MLAPPQIRGRDVTSDPEVDLSPLFGALRRLREANRTRPHDVATCNAALGKALGLLTSGRVRDLVDPLVGDVGAVAPLSVEKQKKSWRSSRNFSSASVA
ncbi:hypothetical protein [Blastococcus brunescens]|uniref:Uncharacterized protein n=1 Tax=Blastococcus brunescens TaxID=1564165 RepID=A0ABZ1B0I5_9ACTN|nr:hypothetical protein [Blastococcus sp. BMG 8361]WRL64314.1 hypothetical protein U6N30_00125 [Blastococcus sp. BMG 8361]